MTSQIPQRSKTPSGTAYIERGHGPDVVVLVHGVGLRADAWHPQIERLSGSHRVIAFDLPGHGGSALLDGSPLLPEFVDWLSRALDELHLETVSLAGHSLGALIAGGAVARMPQRIERVALLNCVYRRTAEARAAVISRAEEISTGVFDIDGPMARWFNPGETGSDAYRLVRSMLEGVNKDGYAAAYRAFARGDSEYADAWQNVTCSALFVTGDGDPNSTPQMSLGMAAVTPNGRAIIIPGHRHLVNLTAPDTINDLLVEWLSSGRDGGCPK